MPKLGRLVRLGTSRECVCVWGAPHGASQAGLEAVIVQVSLPGHNAHHSIALLK